jgi:hypothetical protein
MEQWPLEDNISGQYPVTIVHSRRRDSVNKGSPASPQLTARSGQSAQLIQCTHCIRTHVNLHLDFGHPCKGTRITWSLHNFILRAKRRYHVHLFTMTLSSPRMDYRSYSFYTVYTDLSEMHIAQQLHGTVGLQSLRCTIHFPTFTEPEDSLPRSQNPAAGSRLNQTNTVNAFKQHFLAYIFWLLSLFWRIRPIRRLMRSHFCMSICLSIPLNILLFPLEKIKIGLWYHLFLCVSVTSYQLLKAWTNLYETWYVYNGTWAHFNGIKLR